MQRHRLSVSTVKMLVAMHVPCCTPYKIHAILPCLNLAFSHATAFTCQSICILSKFCYILRSYFPYNYIPALFSLLCSVNGVKGAVTYPANGQVDGVANLPKFGQSFDFH